MTVVSIMYQKYEGERGETNGDILVLVLSEK